MLYKYNPAPYRALFSFIVMFSILELCIYFKESELPIP